MHCPPFKTCASAIVFVASVTSAQASPYDLGLSAGTLGVGPQLGAVIVPNQLHIRLVSGLVDYTDTFEVEGIDYDGDLELRNMAVLVDYHPFKHFFRISGGVILNDTSFSAAGKVDVGETYSANGVTYTAQAGDEVSGEANYDSFAPYVGVGVGSASAMPGLSFTADLGLMFLGSPSTTIDINTASSSNQSDADRYADSAEADLAAELDEYELYPVLQIGATYRF